MVMVIRREADLIFACIAGYRGCAFDSGYVAVKPSTFTAKRVTLSSGTLCRPHDSQ